MAKPTESEVLSILELKQGVIQFNILGTTPLFYHRYARKAWQELLLPSGRKTKADRAGLLKHDPIEEYRETVYAHRTDDHPTRFYFPGAAFKKAMSAAALDIGEESLPAEITERGPSGIVPSVPIPDEGINFPAVVSELERDLLTRSLEKTGGNKRRAALLLNLRRTTFVEKLQRLNVGTAQDSQRSLSTPTSVARRTSPVRASG